MAQGTGAGRAQDDNKRPSHGQEVDRWPTVSQQWGGECRGLGGLSSSSCWTRRRAAGPKKVARKASRREQVLRGQAVGEGD